MNRRDRFSAWLISTSFRTVANRGADDVTELAPRLLRGARKSERDAIALWAHLTRTCTGQLAAKRYDVAAALAAIAVDCCRVWGTSLESRLVGALFQLGYSRHHAGEPALDVLAETRDLLEKFRPAEEARYAATLGLLAYELSKVGRHEEAVTTARQAVDLERTLGSASLPAAMARLDEVLAAAGRH